MAGTPEEIGTQDASGRPQLSAAAGAKSREERNQERTKAALNREYGKHGSDEPFGRTRDKSEQPARSARQDAKSELAQVCAHHDIEHSDRTPRASTRLSAALDEVIE